MLSNLADASHAEALDCDICIVGAGAAGITLARDLAGSKQRVVLLESGSLEPDNAIQALNGGSASGARRLPLDATRLRYFGGTTNHWTGIIAPLFDSDFERERIAGMPGWPIDAVELKRHYKSALETLDYPDLDITQTPWTSEDRCGLSLATERIRQSLLYYSPTIRFGPHYRRDLASVDNVEVVLNATLTDISQSDDAARVEQVTATGFHGHSVTVRAQHFVLACGAIENARQLRLFHRRNPNSPFDPARRAGQYLMDHPTAFCGRVRPTGSTSLAEIYSDFDFAGRRYRPVLSLPPATCKALDTANASAYLWPIYEERGRLQSIRESFSGPSEDDERIALARAVDAQIPIADPNCRAPVDDNRDLQIKAIVEQSPNAANQVQLGTARDALGLELPHIEWRTGDSEHRALLTLVKQLGAEFGRLGVARVRIDDWLLDGARAMNEEVEDYNHPVGCTRMSINSDDGVVDANCKVHGAENLYVSGGSVFATAGINNPTMTIVALAHRLAEHLSTP